MLIEQSIAKQYGVLPSEQKEMKYSDWAVLVAGIMHDTPLGQVVNIRRETDYNVIRKFSAEQKKIYNDWQKFIYSNKTEAELVQQQNMLEKMLSSMFGKKGG